MMPMDTRCNFHTHTKRCKHAQGLAADYCEAALAQGISRLGFTDHTPWPDGRWDSVRMPITELAEYCADIRQAAQDYAGRLVVYLGLECEYDESAVGYLQDVLLGENNLDYIIGAPHSYRMNGEWRPSFTKQPMDDAMLHAYTDTVITSISSGLFDFYAHPDIFAVTYRQWTAEAAACSRAICQAAVAQDVPLEINANGFRKPSIVDNDGLSRKQYPLARFWDIAGEEGVQGIVSSDAHLPQEVWGNTDECVAFAKEHGVKLINNVFVPRRLQDKQGRG